MRSDSLWSDMTKVEKLRLLLLAKTGMQSELDDLISAVREEACEVVQQYTKEWWPLPQDRWVGETLRATVLSLEKPHYHCLYCRVLNVGTGDEHCWNCDKKSGSLRREKEGIEAVIALQDKAGIEETEDSARVLWRGLTPDEQDQAMKQFDQYADSLFDVTIR
jgi:hypothetical protein